MGTVGIEGKLLIKPLLRRADPQPLFTFNQHYNQHHTKGLRMTL
jgi:hypothetical protein